MSFDVCCHSMMSNIISRGWVQIMDHPKSQNPRLWLIQTQCVQNWMEIRIGLSLSSMNTFTQFYKSHFYQSLSLFQCKHTITPRSFSRSVSCSVNVPKGLQFVIKWNQSTANVLNFRRNLQWIPSKDRTVIVFHLGFRNGLFRNTLSLREKKLNALKAK